MWSSNLEQFKREVLSDRQQLRNKLFRLITKFNNGSSTINIFGIYQVDIYGEFEKKLAALSDSQVTEILGILRE